MSNSYQAVGVAIEYCQTYVVPAEILDSVHDSFLSQPRFLIGLLFFFYSISLLRIMSVKSSKLPILPPKCVKLCKKADNLYLFCV